MGCRTMMSTSNRFSTWAGRLSPESTIKSMAAT